MILRKITKLYALITFASVLQMQAQDVPYNGNPDTSFETARELAFKSQRKQAQDTLSLILTKYPNYLDIREFLGTTYSWDGDYKKAEKEFNFILEKDSNRKSTWIASIKNEIYADSPFIALEKAEKALRIFPEDPEISVLKANAQENTGKTIEAHKTIETVLKKNPENQQALDYKSNLEKKLRLNSVGIKSTVDLYSDTFDPMQYHSISYSRKTKYGSIIGRINFDRRFNENGLQYEIDLYPKIAKGFYAYLNFGLSDSFLFPDVRYGAELFKSLPKGFEASLGFRGLQYNTTTTIYTGSLGWYHGNDYWSFRPYITPGDSGISASGTLGYRRYRSDADNYLGFSFGMGFSPESNQFITGNNVEPIITLKAQKIKVDYFFTSDSKRHAWGTQFGITHQEKSFDQGSYFWIYTLGVSYDLRFR